MAVIVVANPKGGVGKSTLSTNLAGHLASAGRQVMLGDVDSQQSSALWLSLRNQTALGAHKPIVLWDRKTGTPAKPAKEFDDVVLDTPAGSEKWHIKDIMKMADKVIVPLQPSLFDIYATQAFLKHLLEMQDHGKPQIALVGMRTDERTHATQQLRQFLSTLPFPVLGYLSDSTVYVQLAARGLTLWDVAPGRVAQQLKDWNGLLKWVKA
jgi:chromosome partitioning protein